MQLAIASGLDPSDFGFSQALHWNLQSVRGRLTTRTPDRRIDGAVDRRSAADMSCFACSLAAIAGRFCHFFLDITLSNHLQQRDHKKGAKLDGLRDRLFSSRCSRLHLRIQILWRQIKAVAPHHRVHVH